MQARFPFLWAVGVLALGGVSPAWTQDAVGQIQKYSGLKKVDLSRLAAGEVEGSRIPAQGSDLSISVESLFAVPLEPARVVELMEDSVSATTVAASDTLDVEGHHPVSVPARLEDFSSLQISPDEGGGRALIKHSATGSGLNLNAAEAELLAKAEGPEALEKTWRKILLDRALAFQSRGWVGSPPYEFKGRQFSMHQEMVRLLKSRPELLACFKDTIGAAMTAQLLPEMKVPGYYWEVSKIQGDRTFTLGAIFSRRRDGGVYQVAEPTFYVSGKYFTSLILYEIHPVTIEGKPHSLVWRGDFIITPSMNFMKGVERIAAENITLLEVRKSVKSFAEECRTVASGSP
jgi:hypothetical protein